MSKIPGFPFVLIILLYVSISCKHTSIPADSIDKFIEQKMEENNIPGMGACVVIGDKTEWSNAYGWADITRKVPFTTDAIMNIASISKTFTATAILQLWEKGLIDIEEDINKYMPEPVRNPNFPDHPITVRQLLTHTSSIIDGSSYYNSYTCGDPDISLNHWIRNYLVPQGEFYMETENFLPDPPGVIHHYSNVGYGLLGYIVEEVSQMPFNEYCSAKIFSPLGMKNTGWFLNEIDTSKHIIPYVYITPDNLDEDRIKVLANTSFQETVLPLDQNFALCFYSFPNYPDGLIRTSIRELSYFLTAIMNNGQFNNVQILKKYTVDMMLSLQIEGNNSQGLCWHKREFESLWGHGGGDPGIKTQLFFSPETNIGIITFQNNNMGDSFEIVSMLYSIFKDLI